jgi:hypothetical protein
VPVLQHDHHSAGELLHRDHRAAEPRLDVLDDQVTLGRLLGDHAGAAPAGGEHVAAGY